jgi:hypothetical protein
MLFRFFWIGASVKNSTIEFYPNYWKIKISLSGWRSVPYEDILDITWKKKFLMLHFQYGERKRTIALNPSVWGKEQVDRIRETLHAKAHVMA